MSLVFLDDSSFPKSVESGIVDGLDLESCNARSDCE